jgi:hypothetical protein
MTFLNRFGGALVDFAGSGRNDSNAKRLGDDRLATDGIWAPGRQHPVQHSHADGSLSLLSSEAAGA